MNAICRQQQRPIQVLLNLIFLLPKNSESDRPLTLTVGLYRVLCKLFRTELSTWDQCSAGFWDQALKGNDALRAAVLSEISAEFAAAGGVPMVETRLGIEKFFDSVQLEWMVRSELRLKYPSPPLGLVVMVHRPYLFHRLLGLCSSR